jgi:pimeloyl-ACP methyl ester carboxylesterase
MPVRSLSIDLDGPYHYVDFGGDGPLVVLVHGIGGSHINWISVGPALAERFHVLAVDMIGFGLTPLAGRRADIPTQQAYLDRFIRAAGGGWATLLGHSMRGLVAMLEAARAPDSVERMVLIDPAACLVRGTATGVPTWLMLALGAFPAVGGRLAGLIPRSRGTEALVTDTLRRAYAGPIDPAFLRAHIELEARRAGLRTPYRGYVEAWRSMRNQHAEGERWVAQVLGPILARTLLVFGTADPLIPQRWFERLARLRPDWDIAPLSGVGHDPHMEAPHRFLEAALPWLQEAPAANPVGR